MKQPKNKKTKNKNKKRGKRIIINTCSEKNLYRLRKR